MSYQLSFLDTPNATSSPALAAGPAPCVSPAGQTLRPSGPAPAHASLSARQAKEAGLLTSATYGRRSIGSLSNADLSPSLASRLRARMDVNGSPEYVLTWTYWDMPSGPPIYALLASARRTSGNGFGGWPTPEASNGSGGQVSSNPIARTRPSGTKKALTTNEAAQLAGWSTPAAREPGGGVEQFLERKRQANAKGSSLGVSVTALSMQAQVAGWCTPTVNDATGSAYSYSRGRHDRPTFKLPGQARGEMPPGFPAPTARRGALNPALSRWLMGYPAAWLNCVDWATRSSRRSRRSS